MSRTIHSYRLPFKIKETLIKHQLRLSGDIFNLTGEQLSKLTHLPLDECEDIIKVVNDKESLSLKPASLLLKQELLSGSIPTLSDKLNTLLGDGFPLGRLCEISGPAGSGKTQLCSQLCVTVQLPENIGLAADALYIDIENSFRLTRVAEMAKFLREKMENSEGLDEKRISHHIYVSRIEEISELEVLILEKLESFLRNKPQIRLIIVDSIAYLFRYDYDGTIDQRNALLWKMSNKLKELAVTYNTCVVVTNHVRYDPESQSVQPALGNRWGHYCALRLFLDRNYETGRFTATLIKSVKQPVDSITFKIGPQGICDELDERPSQT